MAAAGRKIKDARETDQPLVPETVRCRARQVNLDIQPLFPAIFKFSKYPAEQASGLAFATERYMVANDKTKAGKCVVKVEFRRLSDAVSVPATQTVVTATTLILSLSIVSLTEADSPAQFPCFAINLSL